MDSNFEIAKSSSKMKWNSGGHGQSIGLPSVVKAVIHCHTETFLQKSKELVNKFLLKYALLHHMGQSKICTTPQRQKFFQRLIKLIHILKWPKVAAK